MRVADGLTTPRTARANAALKVPVTSARYAMVTVQYRPKFKAFQLSLSPTYECKLSKFLQFPRHPTVYPIPQVTTNRYCSFINYALKKYQ